MKAIEFIAIGTELLNHSRQDSNSTWVAQQLKTLGLALTRKSIVGDVREDIVKVLKESLDRSDLVITCGGLGPTFDDLTRDAIAEAFNLPLEYHEFLAKEIEQFFKLRGREIASSNLRQAYLPQGATPLTNSLGTAPGISLEITYKDKKKSFFFLPGVPRELQTMWATLIQPQIEMSALGSRKVHSQRFVTAGVPESTLNDRTQSFREKYHEAEWTILANLTQVEFLVTHPSSEYLKRLSTEFIKFLSDDFIGLGNVSLESSLLNLLTDRSETLSLAESMTGGLITSRLSAHPGASRVLLGGAVVYSPKLKYELLGITDDMLRRHGPTGEIIASEMAELLRKKSNSTYALAITGNAGPEVDTNSQEAIGEGYIVIAGDTWSASKKFCFSGIRQEIQLRASVFALDLLRREILNRNL
ncbi:MAG: CinA family nicotinamide mononucleotide deamidase-related protein [Holophagaceae bacterium]